MRLFLLPVSTRRTLIFCQRFAQAQTPGAKPPVTERIVTKANETWTGWEKAEKGWKKTVTGWGNQLFRRIPFEEWGLKTIPPATQARLEQIDKAKTEVECLYPSAFLKPGRVSELLKSIATERQGLHQRKMWQSIGIAPLTAPFALVPVVPNLPFFYFVFRAWSHYSALNGGKLLEHLLKKDLVKATPSVDLDTMYTAGLLHSTREQSRAASTPSEQDIQVVSEQVAQQSSEGQEEVMVLQKWNGKLLAEAFKLPEMEVEIERAVEQVEKALEASRKSAMEQKRIEQGISDEKKSDDGKSQ